VTLKVVNRPFWIKQGRQVARSFLIPVHAPQASAYGGKTIPPPVITASQRRNTRAAFEVALDASIAEHAEATKLVQEAINLANDMGAVIWWQVSDRVRELRRELAPDAAVNGFLEGVCREYLRQWWS
jgi:hypothetical protein